MNALITIAKDDLQNHEGFISRLSQLCSDTLELSKYFVFKPKSGDLKNFVEILNLHKVDYSMHSETIGTD